MKTTINDALYRATDPPKILSMTMTSRCNLRCVMCDHGIRNVKKEDFKADLVDMAGGFLASASLVDLTGFGEPMLSDLFWRSWVSSPLRWNPVNPELSLTFNSNGTLLNQSNINRVLQSRVRKIEFLSTPPIVTYFARFRGTDLNAIVNGLRILVKGNGTSSGRIFPKIGVEMTLMRDNLDGLRDMVDLCVDTGVDFLEVWSLNHVTEDARRDWKITKGNWTFDYSEQMIDCLPKAVLERCD